jgi:hypothetical protein
MYTAEIIVRKVGSGMLPILVLFENHFDPAARDVAYELFTGLRGEGYTTLAMEIPPLQTKESCVHNHGNHLRKTYRQFLQLREVFDANGIQELPSAMELYRLMNCVKRYVDTKNFAEFAQVRSLESMESMERL